MSRMYFHRFEKHGKRYAIDIQTCFCFECDTISWDVLEYYPECTVNAIKHHLQDKHPPHEIDEVVGELEWLRSTKAILPPPRLEDMQKQFTIDKDLHTLFMILGMPDIDNQEQPVKKSRWNFFKKKKTFKVVQENNWVLLLQKALNLLYARSGNFQHPRLVLLFTNDFIRHNASELANQIVMILRSAVTTGKTLTLALRRCDSKIIADKKSPLSGHAVSVQLEFSSETTNSLDTKVVEQRLKLLSQLAVETPKALTSFALDNKATDQVWIIVHPGKQEIFSAVQSLFRAKLNLISLDLESAYLTLKPENALALMKNLQEVANEYSARLLKQEHIRLEPLASLFKQIYEGEPQLRGDPTGLHSLAINQHGQLFPGLHFIDSLAFECGNLDTGALNASAIRCFEDVGALTTPDCMRCWAQSLCGGGYASVHQNWNDSFRTPDARWCEGQREWLESAIVAFNALSTQDVNFTRLYASLRGTNGPSLWRMLKAAWSTHVVPRPIQESDASMLKTWENWNTSAYFLFNESGLLLATQYDREMDSLHPRGIDQEYVLTRRNGTPIGLLKMRPFPLPGTMMLWVHFRNNSDYADTRIQKSFRSIIDELTKQNHAIKSVMTPVALGDKDNTSDTGLDTFLNTLNFTKTGIQREALYLHGNYSDITLYTLNFR